MRQNFSSGTVWEEIVGYSRAVKVGNVIEVAGTVAVDIDNNVVGAGDMYLQTKFIIEKIEKALIQAGAGLQHVVRTRMFVTDISKFQDAAKAHGEFFKQIKPVTSMIEVKGLVDDALLIEIEVTAIID